MPEDEYVNAGVLLCATTFPTNSLPGLVYDSQPEPIELDSGDLREPLAQRRSVVVSEHPDQLRCSCFERIEQLLVDPVTGMDDDIRFVDALPHLRRQIVGALGDMSVGQK